MALVIAPLDFRVSDSRATFLFDKFGVTVQDLFRLAIDMWPHLTDDVSYQEQMDTLAHLLVGSNRFNHLSYSDFMTLTYKSMDVLHEFREVLLYPINHLEASLGAPSTQMNFMGWLPDAVVLDVRCANA